MRKTPLSQAAPVLYHQESPSAAPHIRDTQYSLFHLKCIYALLDGHSQPGLNAKIHIIILFKLISKKCRYSITVSMPYRLRNTPLLALSVTYQFVHKKQIILPFPNSITIPRPIFKYRNCVFNVSANLECTHRFSANEFL